MVIRTTGPGAPREGSARLGASPSRRHFLAIGASTLFLAACATDPKPSHPVTTKPRVYTIDSLLSTNPFFIAHRGSGDNWVEHSLDAYSNSIAMGSKAIEVSVNATADGKFVCHHDTSAKRLTGQDVQIADVSYATLSAMQNDARSWLGPAAKPQPIPLLTDVLKRFAETHVIFLEDKQGTNTRALLDVMAGYRDSRKHFVWKQWAGAAQYAFVQTAGYTTWGYFTPDQFDRAEELASRFDLLGVYTTATDEQVQKVVGFGKPVIAWEIHYRSMRERMSRLGVAGMMCSNLPYVTSKTAIANSDAFGTGLRAAGDLPWTTDQGDSPQPTIEPKGELVRLDYPDIQSYLLGSMSPVPAKRDTLGFELRWPESLPADTDHAGLAFGMADDRAYRVRIASDVSGYHIVVRANGIVELFARTAGNDTGVSLGSVRTDPPEPGSWVRVQVQINADTVGVYRLDGDGWGFDAAVAGVTGGYLWLCKNYAKGPAVEFRKIVST